MSDQVGEPNDVRGTSRN